MSENTKGGATGSEQAASGDLVTNLKGEMNRKLGNMEQKVASLEQTNQALLQQLQSMVKPTKEETSSSNEKIEDIWFDKPAQAADSIVSKAEARIMQKITQRETQVAKQNQVLGKLVSEYPELSNSDHELTRKAVEIYSSFDADEKSSPVAYRAAVLEAAKELGVSPKSKRSQDDSNDTDGDDFTGVGGGGSSSGQRSNSRRRERTQVSQETIEFAELLGLDTKDPKVIERIKSGHSRKRGYSNWE